jgi:hypothetical protein
MTIPKLSFIALSALMLLEGCATAPMGPTVQVLPAPNKPFEIFLQEQASCKQHAQAQVAGQADAANQGALGSAVLGTVLGAGLGAAIGGHQGAGVGAATGAIVGTSAGANRSAYGSNSIQYQYNNAFVQCMYSYGNQVPGARGPAYGSMPPPPPMQR